jgi:hypothetical protein
MSFSFNESMVMESNGLIESVLGQINQKNIIEAIKVTARQLVTIKDLESEFHTSFARHNVLIEVEGEHIKNHFVVVLNGLERVWQSLLKTQESLNMYVSESFYENVFTYLDTLVDEVDFGVLFQDEITLLNTKKHG